MQEIEINAYEFYTQIFDFLEKLELRTNPVLKIQACYFNKLYLFEGQNAVTMGISN